MSKSLTREQLIERMASQMEAWDDETVAELYNHNFDGEVEVAGDGEFELTDIVTD